MLKKLIIKAYNPWVIFHVPAVIMLLMLCWDYTLCKKLTSYSGYFALAFFVTTLLLNPLKSFKLKWVWVIKLNRYRRQLGVASFSYVLIHLTCFIIKRVMGGFLQGLVYFLHPAIIPAFFIAFPIMLVMAVTSNNYSVKRLSFAKWKRLHKTVYMAELAVMVHVVLMGSLRLMLFSFVPLCFLQFMRRKNRV
ncbi:MAG: ferric reductase-like transmembrane domain-containing protein [Proteobacteria bacterium]|nr:ferric reductase-like transmembrane domain-containing protein [Pseudomonadota bacterium]